MDCSPPGSSAHEDSPGKNTEVGCLALLQGIFPTQGSNPGLPHCRWILYHLSHQGSPRILEWVAYPFSRGSSQPRDRTQVSCIARGFFTSWATRDPWSIPTILLYFFVPFCMAPPSAPTSWHVFHMQELFQRLQTQQWTKLTKSVCVKLISHYMGTQIGNNTSRLSDDKCNFNNKSRWGEKVYYRRKGLYCAITFYRIVMENWLT